MNKYELEVDNSNEKPAKKSGFFVTTQLAIIISASVAAIFVG